MIEFEIKREDGLIAKGSAAKVDPTAEDFGFKYLVMIDNPRTGLHDFMYVGNDFFDNKNITIIGED